MIVDDFQVATNYRKLHPGFALAFDALRRVIQEQPPAGIYPEIEHRLWVIVEQGRGRGPAAAPLEFHRRYIDIQLVLNGNERIGWTPLPACRQLKSAYDSQRDIGFFSDRPQLWIDLQPEQFAILFPSDAHAPLAGEGDVKKAIAKVAWEWTGVSA